MPPAFRRSPQTWLFYLAYAVFGFVLNGLGPATPFLKSELGLTYTQASLHFSAFAIGMILAGLVSNLVAARLGRKRVLWLSLFGMGLSQLGMAFGTAAWMTIGASFLMGAIGSLLGAVAPAGLADEHGENRSIALSELNLIAAMGSAAAALGIGWFSYTFLGWRFALALPLLAALLLWLIFGRLSLTEGQPAAEARPASQPLPRRFWLFWLAIILVVAVEYCMVFWSADYLRSVSGLSIGIAAQAVSLFQAGMILGRLSASRLLLRFSVTQILTASMALAAAGFLLYWAVPSPWAGLLGLLLTGLGVASQYPLVLSLALGAAPGQSVQASARAGLASGIAVFVLPLFLGRLADLLGIRLAYGVLVVLMLAAFALLRLTSGPSASRKQTAS
jgi:MFS family permease